MAYLTVGSAPGFAGWCLSWSQDQLHLPHEYGSAIDAWNGYSSRPDALTTNPLPGDLAFFDKAGINGNLGHVGILQPDGTVMSVLSDGSIVDSDTSSLGAPFLGYISTGVLHGAAPVDAGFSAPSILPTLDGNALKVLGVLAFAAFGYETIRG